jgi:predicted lysophospholipase L1 biosynthesis ABC-type transport system permease subunit
VVAAVIAQLTFGQVLLAIVIFAALSMWVYWHASKHGSRHATAWGIAVFLIWPAIIVYFVHYYATRRRF